ncbi:MAG: hypothetical protein ACR2IV_13560 [Bryobacteraceae bacterium]
MPLKQEHLDKSKAAEKLALSFNLSDPGAIDWAITLLFYSALHQVEAYFAIHGIHHGGHGGTGGRDSSVANDSNTGPISKVYVRMKTHSINARYNYMNYTPMRVERMKADLDIIKTHVAPLL